jgi:hypothetical protein
MRGHPLYLKDLKAVPEVQRFKGFPHPTAVAGHPQYQAAPPHMDLTLDHLAPLQQGKGKAC